MVERAKVAKVVEREIEREEQATIHKLAEEDLHTTPTGEGKSVLIIIGVLVGIFVLTLGGFKLYNQFTAADVVVIDDLHKQNLAGDLDSDQGYMYGGFSVVNADGLWWTEVEVENRLIKIPLHFGPKDVESIAIIGDLDSPQFNQGEKIYIAIDPEVNYNKYYTLALSELNNNVLQGIKRNIEAACSKENPVCEDRTIVNCAATQGKPVIELVVDENAGVELQGTCIKISGNEYDLVKSVDRLLYHWYHVMS